MKKFSGEGDIPLQTPPPRLDQAQRDTPRINPSYGLARLRDAGHAIFHFNRYTWSVYGSLTVKIWNFACTFASKAHNIVRL